MKTRKSKSNISVRVMWSDDKDRAKAEAEKILEIILSALKQHGYRVSVSKPYKNRTRGGRKYIRVY